MTDTKTTLLIWHPIATAPCDDTWAMVLWHNGQTSYEDFDHDSDPAWWAKRGATHWRLPTDVECAAFWQTVNGQRR